EIENLSPETGEIIRQVCQQKNIKIPRLGIIQDQNPTAFTYGSLPNSARLVVSQGLFTYLDDDEVATVYAHELGHIVHWDFAVMTVASTLVQICYLIYSTARRFTSGGDDNKIKDALKTAGFVAYIFYIIGTYLLLYLSRTREYFADHFAAETTGNPNGLSRALVKIAYGIVEEGSRAQEPSRLIEGTRALGIYDHKAASSTGTAYRISSDPQKIGRVFLWDMFNPWGLWMELNSPHPLTGKRVRALSTY
ncbi:MAG: M48 family metalloprotease, partial [Dolichospermum sp.]